MSRGLRRSNNGEQDVELLDSLQRAAMERVDGDTGHLCQEPNQRNEHEQPSKPCESNKCTCDPGTNATCTCTGATSGTPTGGGTTSAKHTSYPCKHCGDHIGNSSLVRKHKYTVHPTIADHIERDYADYIAATGTQGQGTSARLWDCVEPRDFKQAYADSRDSIERRTGIPAGVTI
jgi:hypothetical protein